MIPMEIASGIFTGIGAVLFLENCKDCYKKISFNFSRSASKKFFFFNDSFQDFSQNYYFIGFKFKKEQDTYKKCSDFVSSKRRQGSSIHLVSRRITCHPL